MLWKTLPVNDVVGKVVVDARQGVGDVEALCSGCQQRVHLVLVALASLSGVEGGGLLQYWSVLHPIQSEFFKK